MFQNGISSSIGIHLSVSKLHLVIFCDFLILSKDVFGM